MFAGGLVLLTLGASIAQPVQQPDRGRAGQPVAFSLDQAVQRALAVSPAVAAATGAIEAPKGLQAQSRWPFPDSPTLGYGRTRRQTPVGTTYDYEWIASIEVEVAGQRGLRSDAAGSSVLSAEARVGDASRLTALEARRSYATLAVAERQAVLVDSAAAFAERLAVFARRQFEAGEMNRLEWNAAVLEAARSRSRAERAQAEAAASAADLARVLALPPDSMPRTTGLPALPSLPPVSDSALLMLARARRPDLRASEAHRLSANQFLSAAKRGVIPNLMLSAFDGREEGTDHLVGFAVGVRIPLFHRQQASIGAAKADAALAGAELAATERAVQAEVLAAASRFSRARTAEERFANEVLRAATENVTLTERALNEGEVDVTDVLVLRSTAVSAQLEYLEVLRDAANAWFELAAALAADPGELTLLLGSGV